MENSFSTFFFRMVMDMGNNFQFSTFNYQLADCHIHMVLDGADWRGASDRHRNGPDRAWIRARLAEYAAAGFTHLRDGGDKWGVGAAARELADTRRVLKKPKTMVPRMARAGFQLAKMTRATAIQP